ncbi:TonB-dependent receptor [Microbulbifer pacificus]|uniref:TonB-dependent receptor n=1 Tax=Microbulbifer pacificus TaxID=407164 RepID=UPI000CF406C5|nr:TonB-dependent receptor [Microbulbifer pacificus]
MRDDNKRHLRLKKSHLALAMSCATLPLPQFALAQQTDSQSKPVFEEVVVTASRREESVMDTPINISAVDGDKIEDLRLNDIAKLAYYTPGLTVVDRGPRNPAPDLIVRGLNTGGLGPGFDSSAVATYLGDTPVTVDLNPVDLERVEVLIGPQGTLYGQGTLGGAIRYIPRKAEFGEYGVTLRGNTSSNTESDSFGHEYGTTLNLGFSDTLALRMNLDKISDPGFIDYNYVVREAGVSNPEPDFSDPQDVATNLRRVKDANGADITSGRINLRWAATDWLEANLWHYYQDTKAEGRQQANQLAFGTGPYESAARFEEPNHYKNQLTSLEVSADLGFAEATLVYGEAEYDEVGQRDQTDLLLGFEYGYEEFPSFSAYTREEAQRESETIELRLVSQNEDPVSWVAGYFTTEYQLDAVSMEFTPGFDQFAVDNFGGEQLRPDSLEYIELTDDFGKESAFYGEISYQITDTWSVTAGYRAYEYESDITGGYGLPLSDTVWGGASPDEISVDLGRNMGDDSGDLFKLNSSWDISERGMVYFTYSQGYRIGGVNAVPECTPEQIAESDQELCAQEHELFFAPDLIDNYEIGYKGLLGDRVSLSAALYYIDWTDLQVASTTDIGNLPILVNGKNAFSRGAELQGQWIIQDNLDLSFSYAYTNAELTEEAEGLVGSYTVEKGARLPGHAEHSGALNLNYSTRLLGRDLLLNYGVAFSSDVYNLPGGPEDPLYEIDEDSGERIAGDRGGEAIPGYAIHHFSATFEQEDWQVQAFVDNLWNKYYITGTRTNRRSDVLQSETQGPGTMYGDFTLRSYAQYVGNPRTVGARVSYRF